MAKYRDYTVWTDNNIEADDASKNLDALHAEYGSGTNAVRVAIKPDTHCPFDTVYLKDEALQELQQDFIVVERTIDGMKRELGTLYKKLRSLKLEAIRSALNEIDDTGNVSPDIVEFIKTYGSMLSIEAKHASNARDLLSQYEHE